MWTRESVAACVDHKRPLDDAEAGGVGCCAVHGVGGLGVGIGVEGGWVDDREGFGRWLVRRQRRRRRRWSMYL